MSESALLPQLFSAKLVLVNMFPRLLHLGDSHTSLDSQGWYSR